MCIKTDELRDPNYVAYNETCNRCHAKIRLESQREVDRFSCCGMCLDCEDEALSGGYGAIFTLAQKDAKHDMLMEKLEQIIRLLELIYKN